MNRYKNQRKIISDNKFERMFAQNLENAGVAEIVKNWKSKNSLQAVVVGEFLYARFPCDDQISGRIKTYCCRYSLKADEKLDFVLFRKYATPVFAPVLF